MPALLLALAAAALAAHGYRVDSDLAFHAGLLLLAGAAGARALRAARRGRGARVLAWNTLLCLCLALSGAEALRPLLGEEEDAPPEPSYSFETAEGDPRRFARWWQHYVDEWVRTRDLFTMPDPRGVDPEVLRPGASGRFLDSEVRINSLGFRGPEIEREKQGRYRIVALGESTTWGATILPDDRPWPEMLQERLAEELDCGRPIEVVNAGVPGWTLVNNNSRLPHAILPLEPDMILSYHGINGFPYLVRGLPSIRAPSAPRTPERPSWLLRRLERSLRLWLFRRRHLRVREEALRIPKAELHATRYAEEYRKLSVRARHHGIALVLLTFNLAVDQDTPEEVMRFYEQAFPALRAQLVAHRLHNRLVREIGALHDLPVIDTGPGLDGHRDYFIDVMHFNQAGRERFVANLLPGLVALLRDDPRLGCAPARESASAAPRPDVHRPGGPPPQ